MTVNPIDNLISRAEGILELKPSDELISKLEKYADDFNNWFAAYNASLTAGKPLNTKSELEQLLEWHEKVVKYSEEVRESMPEEMARLKNKGKGIMAYTDILPKKISFTKAVKG